MLRQSPYQADMIALRSFGGEVPISPPHLLPDTGAQYAENCDFRHGHLAPLQQGFLLTTLTGLVRSIYTEDGIYFYTWTTDTYPVRGPVANDPYERLYYLQSNVLMVSTRTGMTTSGGPPALAYKAGVPAPTIAPTLATVDLNEYPDYPSATFICTAWWYDSTTGTQYQSGAVTLTEVSRLRDYSFVMPVKSGSTPATATLSITFVAHDTTGKPFMTVNVDAGTTSETNALPGNVFFDLSADGTSWHVKMTYGVVETRAYTYTSNNTWLEESAPSPANTIDTTYLQNVAVGLTDVDFTGYRGRAGYRTYRTIGSNESYLMVRDSDPAVSFTDASHKAADVLGSLETLYYEAPPVSLDVIITTDGGSLAGFSGNTLYVSEPYRPHTWQYYLTFIKDIRGICAAPQALVVTTADGCFIVNGSSPANLQSVRLPVPQAGVAQRSMINLDGVTAFASHDGIVSVEGSQASLSGSQKLFARDDWRRLYGSILDDASMRFAWYDGNLVATSYSQALGFLLVLDGEATGMFTRFNVQMDSMFYLPVADTLYYSVGSNVFQFRGSGTLYPYTWWSRDYIFSRERNLGAMYLRSSGPVTVTVYADGVAWYTQTVPGTGYYRLPAGVRSLRWSVKLQGTSTVEELYVARTMRELMSV